MKRRIANLFLRYSPALAGLRRLPLLGPLARWASGMLVPRDSRTWVQIQRGPAKGLWLSLNPRTGGSYLQGSVEPEVQAAMLRHLRQGMTFYDLGANIGFFSLLAARIVGTEGRVVAFEADPQVTELLRQNVERNHFTTVSIQQNAVWSETRSVFFSRDNPDVSPDRGFGHVVNTASLDASPVQAVSLDDFVQTSRAPGFLKCDVEGAEVEVFRGAQRLLKENHPILLCEMHSAESSRSLLQEFASLGYHCEPLDETHILALPSLDPTNDKWA